MAASKTGNNSLASGSNASGATFNTTAVDLHTADYGSITFQMTNGGTAPTTAMQAISEWSPDNTNWYPTGEQISGGLNASQVVYGRFDYPPSCLYARVQFTGNTGQAVTYAAQSYICNSF